MWGEGTWHKLLLRSLEHIVGAAQASAVVLANLGMEPAPERSPATTCQQWNPGYVHSWQIVGPLLGIDLLATRGAAWRSAVAGSCCSVFCSQRMTA
jgi:hypothetical protein